MSNWCSTVAFHMSILAGRCTVGRIRGSTLFSGPRSGIVPSARTAGNALAALVGWLGSPFNPDMLYSGTLSLMAAD